MTRRARVFVFGTIALGTLLGALAFANPVSSLADWGAFFVLALFATLAQTFKSVFKSKSISDTEGTISFSLFLIFLSAGIFLLPPALFVLLVLVPHVVEWINERVRKTPNLRYWYIQSFNIANHICSGLLAQQTYQVIPSFFPTGFMPADPLAAFVALLVYVTVNQLLTGIVVVLARGATWKETGMLQWNELMPDFTLLCLGYPFALLWMQNPLFSLFALAPMLLIQRALAVPQLEKEARTDPKTGLWNAAHFSRLFTAEMERAIRFNRPMSFIMADLDLLRNVNNTYGHLAGDTVLESVSEIIRNSVRDYDIAGRFGGEEFSVCLPETDHVEAIAVAERIRRNIENTPIAVKTSATPIHVTMSFGIAAVPTDAQDTKELVHQADIAVYQAKLRGRNCVVSVTDVPRSIRLESTAVENRLPEAADSPAPAPTAPAVPQVESLPPQRRNEHVVHKRREIPHRPEWVAPYFGSIIAVAILVTLLGLAQNPLVMPGLVAFLCLLAILSEWFEVGMFGESTFSASVTLVFVSIFLCGFAGLAAVSAAIALAHYIKHSEIAWYKAVFRWATHLLAGLVPFLGLALFPIPLVWENLIPLVGLTLVTMLGYYFVESGLVSTAMGLSEKSSIRVIWLGQFDWALFFYAALSLVGLFMAILYRDMQSIPGILVFALPIVLVHLAERQYLDRTRAGALEMERRNEELTLTNREIVEASLQIERLNDDLFATVAKIVDARDALVMDHASRVAEYAIRIARELGLPPERAEKIRQAAFLHDIGKIGIPEAILKKPGRLTGSEYDQVKQHTIVGGELLDASRALRHLATFVRHHHEWWNGAGYPDQLAGEQIPLEARIIAVSGAAEAMASDRPYHVGMPLDQIVAELKRCAGTQFDPVVVEAFLQIMIGEAPHPVPPLEDEGDGGNSVPHDLAGNPAQAVPPP